MAAPDLPEYAAIILSGGVARRLGGLDKPAQPVRGRPLLAWAAAAVPDATPLIVVGPPHAALPTALFVREEPPGAGPVPALRTGLAALPEPAAAPERLAPAPEGDVVSQGAAAPEGDAAPERRPSVPGGAVSAAVEWVALLAGDLPFLRADHVAALRGAAGRSGVGAVLVDGDGREQWLAGVWRVPALRAALAGYGGSSLRGVLGPLEPALVRLEAEGGEPPWFDCDTPEDLERARRSGL
jgi:molybdopterin-guanine dinucleotide biosynthesis protein A